MAGKAGERPKHAAATVGTTGLSSSQEAKPESKRQGISSAKKQTVQILTRNNNLRDGPALDSPKKPNQVQRQKDRFTPQKAANNSKNKNAPKKPQSSAPSGKKRKPTATSMQLGDLVPQLSSSLARREKKVQQSSKPSSSRIDQQQNTPLPTPSAGTTKGQVWKTDTTRVQNGPSNQTAAFSSKDFPSLPAAGRGLNPSAAVWQPASVPAETSPSQTGQKQPAKEQNSADTASKKTAGTKSHSAASNVPSPKSKTSKSTSKDESDATPTKNKAKPTGAATTGRSEKTISISDMFAAKPRTLDSAAEGHPAGDDALQLLRLMQEGKVTSSKTSKDGRAVHRQRIGPRKKKFSGLKKKVLRERVQQWRQLHPEEDGANSTKDASPSEKTVCVWGFAEPDLLEDEDEFEELASNLRDMAAQIAAGASVYIPTSSHAEVARGHPAFVCFAEASQAHTAFSCWNGLTMGGQGLQVELVNSSIDSTEDSTSDWEHRCLDWAMSTAKQDDTPSQVVLENVLTEDDLEDDDCLEESLLDIRTMAEKHGRVCSVQADRESSNVIVSYHGSAETARMAAENLSKTVLGGTMVSARLDQESNQQCRVLLENALSEDDLEDEDCLEESLDDLRELASKYGQVVSVELAEPGSSAVRIEFLGSLEQVARPAADGFNKMVIGGAEIRATVPGSAVDFSQPSAPTSETDAKGAPAAEPAEPEQMFSGDKLIGESWAEMKRVPKIPNKGSPRKYATLVKDESVKPLLEELLGELMRIQKRAMEEDKNTKAKRRLVMGLREVARGIRSQKVRMVVMANNLDEYGVIDDKLQEILDLAYKGSVPVFFEFNKRGLGRALGKSIKIAVVGIQNPDGAFQAFKQLVKLQPPIVPQLPSEAATP